MTPLQETQLAKFKEFYQNAITKSQHKISKDFVVMESLTGDITVKGTVLGVELQKQPQQENLLASAKAKLDAKVVEKETQTQDISVEWNLLGQAIGYAQFSLVKIL